MSEEEATCIRIAFAGGKKIRRKSTRVGVSMKPHHYLRVEMDDGELIVLIHDLSDGSVKRYPFGRIVAYVENPSYWVIWKLSEEAIIIFVKGIRTDNKPGNIFSFSLKNKKLEIVKYFERFRIQDCYVLVLDDTKYVVFAEGKFADETGSNFHITGFDNEQKKPFFRSHFEEDFSHGNYVNDKMSPIKSHVYPSCFYYRYFNDENKECFVLWSIMKRCNLEKWIITTSDETRFLHCYTPRHSEEEILVVGFPHGKLDFLKRNRQDSVVTFSVESKDIRNHRGDWNGSTFFNQYLVTTTQAKKLVILDLSEDVEAVKPKVTAELDTHENLEGITLSSWSSKWVEFFATGYKNLETSDFYTSFFKVEGLRPPPRFVDPLEEEDLLERTQFLLHEEGIFSNKVTLTSVTFNFGIIKVFLIC